MIGIAGSPLTDSCLTYEDDITMYMGVCWSHRHDQDNEAQVATTVLSCRYPAAMRTHEASCTSAACNSDWGGTKP